MHRTLVAALCIANSLLLFASHTRCCIAHSLLLFASHSTSCSCAASSFLSEFGCSKMIFCERGIVIWAESRLRNYDFMYERFCDFGCSSSESYVDQRSISAGSRKSNSCATCIHRLAALSRLGLCMCQEQAECSIQMQSIRSNWWVFRTLRSVAVAIQSRRSTRMFLASRKNGSRALVQRQSGPCPLHAYLHNQERTAALAYCRG